MTGVLTRLVAAVSLVLLLFATPATAQDSFYKGKTVRIIVGASAGGGYDTYSRTIARHMGKHIPGKSDVCRGKYARGRVSHFGQLHVQHRQTGWTDHRTFYRRTLLTAAIGQAWHRVRRRANLNISVSRPKTIMLIGISKKNTGISSMDQWLSSKTIVKLGGVGVGSATDDIPKVLSGNDRASHANWSRVIRERRTSGWRSTAVKFKACATLGVFHEPHGETS